MPTQASHNHHYIPRFYSKRWAIYGGRLCQYSRPRKLVVPERKYPKQIGFEPNLYTLPGLLKQHQTEIEDKVFRVIDQRASDAVAYLIAHPKGPFSAEIRSDFTRFVMSFLHRTPERVVELKAKFLAEAAIRNQTMQQEYIDQGRALPGGISFDEFNEQQRRMILSVDWGKLLVRLVDSEFLGQRINDMIWTVRSVAAARLDMLTCDKPVIRTNGFAHAEGHFALPLTPSTVFLATNNYQSRDLIMAKSDDDLVRLVNERIALQATRYVYGTDDTHLAFLEKRLGKGYANIAHQWTDKVRAASRLRIRR